MSLTVKAFLEKNSSSEPYEIRRFAVDEGVASSYDYLSNKIRQVFPDLGTLGIKLYWKDTEGDFISFSSDEELTEALGFIDKAVFRVHIRVQDGEAPQQKGVLHPYVTCDACDGPVEGNRYKCTVCHDYDLCNSCMSKELHPEHDMIVIRTPRPAWMGFMHRGGPFGPRGRGGRGGPFRGCGRGVFGPRGPFGFQAGCGNDEEKADGEKNDNEENKEGEQGGRRAPPPFGIWMKKQMRRWQRMMEAYGNMEGTEKAEEPMEGGEGTTPETEEAQKATEYLMTIGDQVAQMLDPLGIDVAVDVEHGNSRWRSGGGGRCGKGGRGKGCRGGGKKGNGDKAKEKADTKDVPMADVAEPSTPNVTSEPKDVIMADNAEPEPSETKQKDDTQASGSNSPKTAEWTLMDYAVPTDLNDLIVHTQAPSAPAVPQAPAVPAVPLHPNPTIASALVQMQTMGFNNEGGWLVQLLESKDGDISKVLDAMHPSRPQ